MLMMMMMMAKSKPKKKNSKKHPSDHGTPEVANRKARHKFHITDTLECGIVLMGTEVKSVRAGKISVGEGYARVDEKTGELWLFNIHIGDYDPAKGNVNKHDPHRKRKLLAHKREIRKLQNATLAKGATIVPLKLYFTNGYAKMLVGVGIGKRKADVREDSKKRDAQRDIDRAMTRRKL